MAGRSSSSLAQCCLFNNTGDFGFTLLVGHENWLCLVVWYVCGLQIVLVSHRFYSCKFTYLFKRLMDYPCPQKRTLDAWLSIADSKPWLLRLSKQRPLKAVSIGRPLLAGPPELWPIRANLRTVGLLAQRTLKLLERGGYSQPVSTPTWTEVRLSPDPSSSCRVAMFFSSFAFRVWEWVLLLDWPCHALWGCSWAESHSLEEMEACINRMSGPGEQTLKVITSYHELSRRC